MLQQLREETPEAANEKRVGCAANLNGRKTRQESDFAGCRGRSRDASGRLHLVKARKHAPCHQCVEVQQKKGLRK